MKLKKEEDNFNKRVWAVSNFMKDYETIMEVKKEKLSKSESFLHITIKIIFGNLEEVRVDISNAKLNFYQIIENLKKEEN